MKMSYYPETDTLCIDFSEKVSAMTKEIFPNVTADFDEEGRILNIDIEHASKTIDISKLDITPIIEISEEGIDERKTA